MNFLSSHVERWLYHTNVMAKTFLNGSLSQSPCVCHGPIHVNSPRSAMDDVPLFLVGGREERVHFVTVGFIVFVGATWLEIGKSI